MKRRSIGIGLVSAAVLLGSQSGLLANCGSCGGKAEEKKPACASCEVKKDTKAAAKGEATVSTAGLKAILDAKTAVTLLDARSGKFDDGRRIPGAKSLNAGSSAEEVARIVPEKNGLVITYCAGLSCGASHKLAEYLRKAGYLNVVEYPEGIAGWVEGGNAVEVTNK